MQKLKSVRDAEVAGKRVLVRVDFNVPLKDGKILDDNRIRAALPTIALLKERGAAQVVILTHLGRPGGKATTEDALAPVEERFHELMPGSGVSFFENLRFDPSEEANDSAFAQRLAALGDVFVNDAFAVSHRAHASVVGITQFLPSYAGLLIEKEVERLTSALTPPTPALAIVAGAKFETKMPLIQKLLGAYGTVLLGGALANDLFKARGVDVKKSVVSKTSVPQEILNDTRVVAPLDYVWANDQIIDIGEKTIAAWSELIANHEFVLWNGPVGLYEEGHTAGTDALAQALVRSGVAAVIGGGNTAIALAKVSFDPQKVFISTGGGAALEFLTNGTLPGLEPLLA